MRVGIDARWIQPEITGIGSYTQSLIRHLVPIAGDTTFVLLFDNRTVQSRTLAHAGIEDDDRFETAVIPYGPFSLKSQIQLPSLLRALRVDLYHSPNFMIPIPSFPKGRRGKIACIVTIHDLIPLLFPEFTPRAIKTRFHPVFRRLMREVGARADGIITVSESSRRDILQHMDIPADRAERVQSIYEGVSQDYSPLASAPSPKRSILYVGRMDPYKNVLALVKAFSRLVKSEAPDATLRIIGPKDPRYPEVEELIRTENIQDSVDWPGYVSGESLLQAYREASVFVLPSRYEGFGLPVLEAMACGTPVICSNCASLPEVAGDAAYLIDPTNPDALHDALLHVLTHNDIAQSMRIKGLRQAARFSWEQTAVKTLDFYKQILSMP